MGISTEHVTHFEKTSISEIELNPTKNVRTTSGCIIGQRRIGVYGDLYYSFEGIPFAEPPLGELRFMAPKPAKKWTNTLDCTKKNTIKPKQHNFQSNITEGSEDCLYLNIYVKQFDTKDFLPIMAFIHGGGFQTGDPTTHRHGPDYFMTQKLVLVTIGYRLGALGFISFQDPSLDCPGNAGLKDQLLALRWLKANAKKFNGDPNNITVFGSSAGAASIHLLSLAPRAKNLFHKMILQSGVATCPFAISTVKCLQYRLAEALNYAGPMTEARIFKFLQSVDAADIVRTKLVTIEEQEDGHIFSFGPVIEPYQSSHCLLPHTPEVLFAKAWGNDVPLLIGGNSFEGLIVRNRIMAYPFLLDSVRNNVRLLLPQNLRQKFCLSKQNELGKILKTLYFGDNEINIDNLMRYCQFSSYKLFWHPIHRTIMARQWFAPAPTYVYRFDFDSPYYNLHRLKACGPGVRGVCHGDELSYLFHNNDSFELPCDSLEYLTIQRMIQIWTNFAETSIPYCENLDDCEWAPLEQNDNEPIRCLNINAELEVINLPELRTLDIWKSFYKESYNYDEED